MENQQKAEQEADSTRFEQPNEQQQESFEDEERQPPASPDARSAEDEDADRIADIPPIPLVAITPNH